MLPSPPAPFILLDDARPEGSTGARLYVDPVELVIARAPEEVQPALDCLADAQARGLHAAGYLAYEAGFAFEPRLLRHFQPLPGGEPLLWFGLFRDVQPIPAADVPKLLPAPSANRSGPVPQVKQSDYAAAFDRIQSYLRAGDIYQANLTFPCSVAVPEDPLTLYAVLRDRAGAGHGAVLFTGTDWLLSFSPELFFTLEAGVLTARPMKGTAARGADSASDAAAMAQLQADPKQRAENLMIVDLLRNDLSRIAEAGSVVTPDLFHVESYPTVHQMTSTIKARLRAGLGPVDVLRAIFPCGSITGAPKLRAMEVIHEVETGPRGAYTGSIGCISSEGDAAFNVAIRTISVNEGSALGRFGLGSGVVADSVMQSEWDECLEKGRFLGEEPPKESSGSVSGV
jgi:aminodeoxychorismate synthase component I